MSSLLVRLNVVFTVDVLAFVVWNFARRVCVCGGVNNDIPVLPNPSIELIGIVKVP